MTTPACLATIASMEIRTLNHKRPKKWSNRFYCLRHGRSLANEAGLIISDPAVGSSGWGLAPGAEKVVRKNLVLSGLNSDTVICTSPFTRARETADIAVSKLGSSGSVVYENLKERWFGDWEGSSYENYHRVWALDKFSRDNDADGVESPLEVLERLLTVLFELDTQYSRRDILLVSHGDPIDILLTWTFDQSLTSHMDLGMETAEIRPVIVRTPSSAGT